jgi:IS4 transposase
LSPTAVREAYRKRFGIETSYRQLNQSRSRTSSRDPLYRLLLVGLSLFLRNVWQWLVRVAEVSGRRARGSGQRVAATAPPRYQDILDDFTLYLLLATQVPISPSCAA